MNRSLLMRCLLCFIIGAMSSLLFKQELEKAFALMALIIASCQYLAYLLERNQCK